MLLLGIIVGCSARQEPEQALPTVTETVSQVTDATSTPRPQATSTPVPTKPIQEEGVSHIPPTPTPDSPPVRLVIPALGIDVPVVEVGWHIVGEGEERRSEWQTADYAAGHHVNSANPGQVGNVVISGHHNIKGKVFEQISRDIDRKEPRLIPGAEIQVYTADGRDYTYQVEQVLLLQEVGASEEERRKNAQWMAPTDEPSLTLITCWPFWTNTHRVIVRAKLQE
ncbi:MAG: sortase [Chloroflexi bacterium]|nr:sortase [Chloroflexota bacterium]